MEVQTNLTNTIANGEMVFNNPQKCAGENQNIYYVYQHIRLDNNTVFYIGKGNGKRAHDKIGHSTHWKRIVQKHGYRVEFVNTHLDEQTAFELEVETIKFYGRLDLGLGLLINKTDGGEGASGVIVSQETRAKISANSSRYYLDKTLSSETKKSVLRRLANAGDKNPMFGRTGDKNPAARKVTNQFGEIFDTLTDAAKWCGLLGCTHISACCRGKKKSAGRHPITKEPLIWSYAE